MLSRKYVVPVYQGLLPAAFLLSSAIYGQTIFTNGTVNSADYSRSFAPGAIVSIFGSSLATAAPQQAGSFPLPTSLAGAMVLVAGQAVPLWYASSGQINAELPFNLPTGPATVQVKTSAGTSNTDTITIAAQAPKFFTMDFSGTGAAVATNSSNQLLSATAPATAAAPITLWMNSLGATNGSPVAGQPAPGMTSLSSALSLLATPAVTINNAPATVTFAGLSPGTSGLYQINLEAPFVILTGPLYIQVTINGVSAQANVTVPYRQMGYYSALLGGVAVPGQTVNDVGGTGSALAFRQNDQTTWGSVGYDAWTNNTGLASAYSIGTGEAFTLYNGGAIVFDNNGIETGSYGTFYNNTGGGADSSKPGLSDLYSMSNYFPLVFSGYMKLSQSTTITQVNAYFDALVNDSLPFDPYNPYVQYRVNIFSNTSSTLPTENGSFTGDVFSSDTNGGSFTVTDSGARMISSLTTNAPKIIYRMTYKLKTPITLPAGVYWLSHDASILSTPTSTTANTDYVSAVEIDKVTASQPRATAVKVNLFGREMILGDTWNFNRPAVAVPSSPVVQH